MRRGDQAGGGCPRTGSGIITASACVFHALTKLPTTGRLAAVKYSVNVLIGEDFVRTGFPELRDGSGRLSARGRVTSFGFRMRPDAEEER